MLKAEITGEMGKRRLTVGGKEAAPFAYMTYRPENGDYSSFKSFGTRLFSLSVYLGTVTINMRSGLKPFKSGVWTGYREYDFSGFDSDIKRIWNGEKDVFIFPRVYIDCPEWWEKTPENAPELCRDQHGNPVRGSYASEVWRGETLEALFGLISHIESSEYCGQIIGYQIAAGGTEEWLSNRPREDTLTDYCEKNRAAFQKWLCAEYNDITSLNRSWGVGLSSFEEVQIPSERERRSTERGYIRETPSERRAVDFYRFHSDMTADTIAYFCEAVKKRTQGQKLVGTFYGYVTQITDCDHGHHALSRLLKSGTVDFIAAPNSYEWRFEPGLDWPFMSATDSVVLHGAMWFAESDTRTHLSKTLRECWPEICPDNGWYDSTVWLGPESVGETVSNLTKNAARILTNNAGTWWFDMWGGWYRDRAFYEFFEKACKLFETEHAWGGADAETAVFVDERSYAFFTDGKAMRHAVFEQRRELGLFGAPYHIYLSSDIEEKSFSAEKYRLCIFLNLFDIPESTREAVNKKLKKDNRTLLWSFLPDFTKDKGQIPLSEIAYAADTRCYEKLAFCHNGVVFPDTPLDMPRLELCESGEAELVAKAVCGGLPGAVMKDCGDYKTVWSAAPCIPAGLIRELARGAGAHIFCETNDVIYASGSLLAICAASEGKKTVKLKKACDVRDYFGEKTLGQGVCDIRLEMKKGETKLFCFNSAVI